MERIARSATPLNWCTYGGQVVLLTPWAARNSVNSCERNSPALSECREPITSVVGVHSFETSVIIYEDEQVLVASVLSANDRTGKDGMDDTSGVGRLIGDGGVRLSHFVGFCARGAPIETAVHERNRRIGGDGRQRSESYGTGV
eukprot:6183127-Pleurochrysis_carterae.AAC.1